MNPTIRGANSGDIPDIQSLYRQLDDHHADLIPEVFQPLDWNARADCDIQEAIDREDMEYLVAICDEKVVGFVQLEIAIQPDFPVFRPREYALMDSAVVDKPYRRKGIGRMLCKAAVEWCRARGTPQIQTNVWDKNVGAREFYLDFGFRPMCVKLELDIGGIEI
ncbi:MAG: GNAT family N-acetyltransferase [Candidatus Omnitrophica bacterium]|nr:GNAT family N-acetyltransferase [Candidatus Omnitrophota bacterium]